MSNNNQHEFRFGWGLGYAYGRYDEQIKQGGVPPVDPIQFAEFYASQYDEFVRGETSWMPPVREVYDVYRRSQP